MSENEVLKMKSFITNKSESDLFLIGGRSSFSEELILHEESSASFSNMQKISQIKI